MTSCATLSTGKAGLRIRDETKEVINVRTKLAIKVHSILESYFPERRVFLKSDTDTRFIRLRPGTQLVAFAGCAALVAWAIVATAIILMDSIGSGNFREQAKRDQRTYQARLNDLSSQRDLRAEEALAAQERFNAALAQISMMQSELLSSETRRRELETGIEVIQSTLRETMHDREAARTQLAELEGSIEEGGAGLIQTAASSTPIDFLASALERTAKERDQVILDSQDALLKADEMEQKIALMQDRNDALFRQLEEAMTVSVAPLDKMFRDAGMPIRRAPTVCSTRWTAGTSTASPLKKRPLPTLSKPISALPPASVTAVIPRPADGACTPASILPQAWARRFIPPLTVL